MGQSATFERALTTEIPYCLVRARWSVDFKVVQPSNTSCWESRKARLGDHVKRQLVELGPSFRRLVVVWW